MARNYTNRSAQLAYRRTYLGDTPLKESSRLYDKRAERQKQRKPARESNLSGLGLLIMGLLNAKVEITIDIGR